MKSVGIIGGGFIGQALASLLDKQKYQVKLSFRSKRPEVTGLSISVHHCDVSVESGQTKVEADRELFKVDCLVICIPPGFKKGLGDSYTTKIQTLLEQAQNDNVKQVIFTSSIGIYDQKGKVDELSTLNLSTEKQKALYDAEQAVLNSGLKTRQVLRLAGLIGGSRHPGNFRVSLTEENINEPVNMVMQEDVVQAIALLIEQGESPSDVYNIVSPHHPNKQSFYRYARQKIKDQRANEPLVVSGIGRESREAFTGKTVEGDRICQELGFKYQFDNLFQIYD